MPDTKIPLNGWNEWGKHILIELESNTKEHTEIKVLLNELVTKYAILETKMAMRAGTIGMMSGGIMSIIVGVVIWLITK